VLIETIIGSSSSLMALVLS